MKIQYIRQDNEIVSGITLKDETEPEVYNLALHCCQEATAVLNNRRALADELGVELEQLICANQTHSANLYKVTKDDLGRGSTDADTAIPNTDALYTFEKDLVLCTFTADCVPVTFYDPTSGLIGVIHSGWQGTVKEISLRVMDFLKNRERLNPENLQVHIGTALSQHHFEVDEDVYIRFKALGYANNFIYFNEDTSKYHIDNQLVVKTQFELSGVPSDNIQIDPTCTFDSNEGFSYRQCKQDGRHLTFIYRR